MSIINFNSVTFYYPESVDKVFDKVNLNVDTTWKLGLTGKNGRGKSTLLRLINKDLQPVKGIVFTGIKTFYFPYIPLNAGQTALNVIRENIASFDYWEERMKVLLDKSDEESLKEYGEILEYYETKDGYEINSIIEKEFFLLGMNNDLLHRNFETLSGGEQTRALIISLFLRNNSFPLIDEPTDNLDMKGRDILGEYLSGKKGFILASHDRNLLDICTDHILSINKSDVRLCNGNYSQWKYNMDIEEEFEIRKNENLSREVKSLEIAARKGRNWSTVKEKEKSIAKNIGLNKGNVGHKAAKLMKRALHIESRINRKLEEKKSLLKNVEDERKLKITKDKKPIDKLLSVQNAALEINGRVIFENINFEISKGERIAITGNNGSGKTSIIKAILKEIKLSAGDIYIPGYATITYSRQNPLWDRGYLRDHLQKENIDETKFRNIMGVMGAWGELFERPLETFSKGQIKKAELCKSFLNPSDLLIWDEPLNYLDIYSREQIENVILEYEPTIIFTEHDRKFVENVSTKIVEL